MSLHFDHLEHPLQPERSDRWQLVFQADNLEQIAVFTNAALATSHRIDGHRSADKILQAINMTPNGSSRSPLQKYMRPAILASVGLLVTAALALASLSRRGPIRR